MYHEHSCRGIDTAGNVMILLTVWDCLSTLVPSLLTCNLMYVWYSILVLGDILLDPFLRLPNIISVKVLDFKHFRIVDPACLSERRLTERHGPRLPPAWTGDQAIHRAE